jgi:hypothetical protein
LTSAALIALRFTAACGSTLPLPPTDPAARYDRRVDKFEFIIGQYVIRFGEIYREA